MDIKLDVQWAAGPDPVESIDPLVFRLLAAVERGCSLRRAAQECASSYRHAWGLMRHWEDRLGRPLLVLERGRGAALSDLGRGLLWAQRRAQARLGPALDSLGAELAQELGSLLDQTAALRLIASHDLALELLRQRYAAQAGRALNVQYRGSLDAVRQLIAGRCELAGYHIPDLPGAERISAEFARLMPPGQFRSVRFVDRSQGLILPAGNPGGLSQLEDLARDGLVFINRQPGSGTRLLFDRLLAHSQIEPAGIRGYENEEFTHLAVAAMVASGAADAGFGVQAAAERFGLAFVPMVREHYLLAYRLTDPLSERLAELLDLLQRDRDLGDAIHRLPGYDVSCIGQAWPPET